MKKLSESKGWNLFWMIFCIILMVLTIIVSAVYSLVNAQIIVLIAVFGINVFVFFVKYKEACKEDNSTEKK